MLLMAYPAGLFSQEIYVGSTMDFTSRLENSCGIVYRERGLPADPFVSLSEHGANIIRLNIDLPPYSSSYSEGEVLDFRSPANVKKSMKRAKDAGLMVELTFGYQSYALEDSQKLNPYVAPLAWQGFAADLDRLEDTVYSYTFGILDDLCASGLFPAIVSIGNESVWHRLMPNVPEAELPAYSPERSVRLHNAGSKAVRDISAMYGKDIKVCFHMMDPTKAEWWLGAHQAYGPDFDILGISHYYSWTNNNFGSYSSLAQYIKGITTKYGCGFLILETAQLFTSGGSDDHANILGPENIPEGYPNPPTTETQKRFLTDLTNTVLANGGCGVIVWGGEWVGSDCYIYADQWGKGSSWENKTFWDFSNNLHDGVNWMIPFTGRVPVKFMVNMSGKDTTHGVYIKGDLRNLQGKTWEYIPMESEGNGIFSYSCYLPADSTGAYYFLNDNSELAAETVPASCAAMNDLYRSYNIPKGSSGEVFATVWSECDTIVKYKLLTAVSGEGSIDPSSGTFAKNSSVTLTATASSGWEFSGWGGDTVTEANPLTLLMDSDITVTAKFVQLPEVVLTFKVDMTGISVANGVWVTGDFKNNSGLPWQLNKMSVYEGNNIYSYAVLATVNTSGAYYFLKDDVWGSREKVPSSCALKWGTDRLYTVGLNDTVFAYKWGSCTRISDPAGISPEINETEFRVFPNPLIDRKLNIVCGTGDFSGLGLFDLTGRCVFNSSFNSAPGEVFTVELPAELDPGLYLLQLQGKSSRIMQKLFLP
jgi:arabinogalactan endo-1,4-beta-galactosidase